MAAEEESLEDFCTETAEDLSFTGCQCSGNWTAGSMDCYDSVGDDVNVVIRNGSILLMTTTSCSDFMSTSSSDTENFCITFSYTQTELVNHEKSVFKACSATLDGTRCSFCARDSFSCIGSDSGVSLRCKDYNLGSLCPMADGSMKLSLTKFGNNSRSSSSNNDPAMYFIAFFVAFLALIARIIRRQARSTTISFSPVPNAGMEMTDASERNTGSLA